MPIEIIPREKKKVPSWQPILFYLFLALLFLTIAGYLILVNFQNKYKTELEDLDNQLAQFKTPDRLKLENDVLALEEKMKNFSAILDEHSFISGVLKLIEDTTHPKVKYIKFTLIAEANELGLSGETDDFLTLGQQVILLKNNPKIQSLDLTKVSINKENKVEFDFRILLDPDIFKQ